MNAERIAAIRARWERITRDYQDWPDDPTASRSPALNPERAAAAAAHACHDVPDLVAEVERLTKRERVLTAALAQAGIRVGIRDVAIGTAPPEKTDG